MSRVPRQPGAGWLLFAAMAVAAVVAWALVPTFPNYDAYAHLNWGRELLDGHKPSFETYAAPTEHPLYLALCGILALLFGGGADRALVLLTVLCHVVFMAGVFRLGRALWDWRAGAMAALLAGSSFALLLYAAFGYVDELFLVLVIWAAVVEAEHAPDPSPSRRGTNFEPRAFKARPSTRVYALLALAGLLRPDAWILAGLYWLWRAHRAGRADRVRQAAAELPWVLAAPVLWCAVDLWVTGDPLYSLHATSELADALNRSASSIGQVPRSLVRFLVDTAREPVAAAAVVGAAALVWRRASLPTRAAYVPLALFLAGTITFVATSVAGLSLLPRYLTVPAVALCLPAGWLVTRSRVLLGLAVLGGIGFIVLRTGSFERLATELKFVKTTHRSLSALLHTPQVAQARRCGPVTLPTYRLVPDARWILDAPPGGVRARSEQGVRTGASARGGVAVLYTEAKLLRRYGFAAGTNPMVNLPPEGFTVAARRGGFVALVRCP